MEPGNSIDPSAITGLLLAGGLGRRMGGADKGLVALKTLDGRTMASWILERLRPQVGTMLINANRNFDEWNRYGERVVSDEFGKFAGPLAGIHAGLRACSTPWLVSTPCDSPFLPHDLVARLAADILNTNADVASVRVDSRLQPVFALIRHDVLPLLEEFLLEGGRSIEAWFRTLHWVAVDFDNSDAFANFNSPEELAGAHLPT